MHQPRPTPPDSEVERVLTEAVRVLYRDDGVLIDDQTHERSIVFQVGRYLAVHVDDWFGPWNVDVEYNRLHDDGLEIVSKTLYSTARHPGGRVVPDLIVHDRSESSRDSNLLVVEAKLRPTSADRFADCCKLGAYLEVLEYRHAVFLEFTPYPRPPRWRWFTTPDQAYDFADQAGNGAAADPMW